MFVSSLSTSRKNQKFLPNICPSKVVHRFTPLIEQPGEEAGQVEDLVCLRGNNALQVKDLLPSFRAANSKGGPYRKRSHMPTTIQKSTSYLKSSINFQGENQGKDTSKPYNNYNVTIHLMCQSL